MTSSPHLLKRLWLPCLLLFANSLAFGQVLTTLVVFNGANGENPRGTLAQSRDGNLRGTTLNGGSGSLGTAFAMTPTGIMKYLSFDGSHGGQPSNGFLLGTDNRFYGTTISGPTDFVGSVFEMSPTGAATTLFSFDGNDGSAPEGSLVQATDGNFYGTTFEGGSASCGGPGCGTVFRITPSGALTTLYAFDSLHGAQPLAGLVQGTDGNFYGTTSELGADCCGTVFRMTPAGQLTAVHMFGGGSDGMYPSAPLIEGTDRNFYGTTQNTIFKISPNGVFQNLYTFAGETHVTAPLTEGTDGNFYGVNALGGNTEDCGGAGCGTVFQITPAGVLTTLYSFSGLDGQFPNGGLVQHSNGKFYGTTGGGSQGTEGTIFSLDMGFGPFITFVRRFGRVGSGVQILGQGLTGTTAVTFNGVPATTFQVLSDTFMAAIVPPGATTGPVEVTTPNGVLTSNVNLQIVP